MIEHLETRRMLAATLSNGVLTVTGSGGNDTIHVRAEGSQLVLFFNVGETKYKLSNVKKIVMNGRAGNDWVANGTSIPAKLVGGDGADLVSGGNSNDTLMGGGGGDKLYGQGGNDLLDGGLGNDQMIGGSGTDTATYYNRKTAVEIFLNGAASGGVAESDTLTTIENARGGFADDTLHGDAANNKLHGGEGHDLLDGGAGSDTLFGQAGDDTFIANDGEADIIVSGDGDDSAAIDEVEDDSDAESVL